MIRAGIHLIASGVRKSRRFQRYRLEAQEYNHRLRIRQFFEDVEDKANRVREIGRLNHRLPPEMRLEHCLAARYPYSKKVDDIPTSSKESYEYRLAVRQSIENSGLIGKEDLLAELPQLEEPSKNREALSVDVWEVDTSRPLERHRPSKFVEKWYNWWHKRMPALGMLDVAVGQLMLFCAIGSILLMTLNTQQVPSIFQILANDPGLSLTFTFILLANWVNCTRTGWRMLTWPQREARRNCAAAEMELLDAGLERKSVEDFHEWIKSKLAILEDHAPESISEVRKAIEESHQLYLDSLPDFEEKISEVRRMRIEGKKESENCLLYGVHKLGKKIVPKMGTPSIVVGGIIALLGIACLVMSVTHHIPPEFSLLAKNTPLSVLFSCGLLVSGIYAAYRGVAIQDQVKKEGWKKSSRLYREQFLKELYPELEPPRRTARRARVRTLSPAHEIDLETAPQRDEENRERIASCCSTLSDNWFRIWRKSLGVIWLPDLVLGSFILFSSLAGIAICLGAPASSSLQFISGDPSFSLFFCIGLVTVGIDALCASWRIASYQNRRKQKQEYLEMLSACYRRFQTNNSHGAVQYS